MAYLVVDKKGNEWLHKELPVKNLERGEWECRVVYIDQLGVACRNSHVIPLPKGSIESLTDQKLDWGNAPVHI